MDTAPPLPESGDTAAGTAPSTPGLASTTEAAASYLLWWASGLIFLWLEPRDRFVRFHAAQAVFTFGVLWTIGLALWVASFAIVFLAPGLLAIAAVAGLGVWTAAALLTIVAVVQAWRGRWWSVPGIGVRATRRAERWFDRVSADAADATPEDR